ncbi:MAG: hypothetical protein UX13_C0026G0025 [Candidatus Woesebacteria bacterium GW2011_GWB1_45_5]|uniref:Thioredoxin domain-containing protein n=1 Tax=Candidatus Woesebacteria bacterium GW2011_GWB1_45_5 TaxID=1618581 RepID=A0A0G1MNZ9_9BACT|nr:MAG: hypothetical protein UX13_C0026G0025 [Candidatus Woesebacteria bacterium GW2011_GWB1_45_5]
MKSKFGLLIGLATLVIVISGVFLLSRGGPGQNTSLPSNYEYFWGDGCPHCANVQAFFDTWDKKDQVNINKLEVWNSPTNARLMQERAKYCNISPSGMGVPFLFTPEGKCLSGDASIVDFFKSL